MGASVRPDRDDLLARQIAALQQQGASDEDIQSFLNQRSSPRLGQSKPATPEKVGHAGGVAGMLERGLLFGFGDELRAAIKTPFSGKSYDEHLATERARDEAYADANPGKAIAAEVAGGALSGAVAGGVLRSTQAGRRIAGRLGRMGSGRPVARAAKVVAGGAAAGGLAGAGAASDGNRLDAAATGAGFGAGAAGALGATGKVVGAVAAPFLPRPPQGTLRGGAVRLLGGETAEDAAKGDILKQLGRSRMTVDDLEREAANALPEEMLLDIGGEAMVDRAGGMVATPSRGSVDIQKALLARRQAAPKQLTARAQSTLGVQRQNTARTVEELADARSAEADEMFGAIRQHYGEPVQIAELDEMVGRPSFDSAVKQVERYLREQNPRGFQPLVKGGKFRPVTFDEARLLKQAMDEAIDFSNIPTPFDAGGVGPTVRSAMTGTRGELLDVLKQTFPGDEAAGVPSYEQALTKFADRSKLLKAHQSGQGFMKAKTDELEALWPTLSEPEKEFYRRGAIAAIEDAVRAKSGRGANPTMEFLDDIMRDNLRVIYPDPASFDAFMDVVRRQDQMHGRVHSVLGNSKTASRLAQQGDPAGDALEVGAAVASGSPLALAKLGLWNAAKNRYSGLTEQHVDALAPLMTAQGPELQALARALKAEAERRAQRVAPSRRLNRAASQAAGSQTGSP